MRIEYLRYFTILAHEGSFYRATKSVFLSQQGLNKAISSLESELDVKLVDRSRNGIRLTKGGEIFLAHAKKMLADYDAMLEDILDARIETPNSVETLPVYSTYYPIHVASSFPDDTQMFRLTSLEELDFHQVVKKCNEGDSEAVFLLDVNQSNRRVIEENPDMVFESLLMSRYGIILREDNPMKQVKTIHRDMIATKPIACNSQEEVRKVRLDFP